jgi:hypothetical protein
VSTLSARPNHSQHRAGSKNCCDGKGMRHDDQRGTSVANPDHGICTAVTTWIRSTPVADALQDITEYRAVGARLRDLQIDRRMIGAGSFDQCGMGPG